MASRSASLIDRASSTASFACHSGLRVNWTSTLMMGILRCGSSGSPWYRRACEL